MQDSIQSIVQKRWYTTQQAANHLQCSPAFLHHDRLTRLHGIPFARLGRHIRYDVADLDAFLERSKAQTQEAR